MTSDILSGKKIILGVTGCIAAYKACYIVRELVKRGAEVKVAMTQSAVEFITPLTLATLSKNDIIVNTFPNQKEGRGLNTWHIDVALWADLFIIAPATVNTIAKIAHGFADNALTTLISARRAPMIVSPAADACMYESGINLENILKLKKLGVYILDAEIGELASGLEGTGRLPEIEKIIDAAEIVLSGHSRDFEGKKILVSAGPTFEDIDPVRFIGNRSSGKMGYAIAKAAYLRGADVTLISGPSSENVYQEINKISVRSADEMKNEVNTQLEKNDLLIMAAAVADYRPKQFVKQKIKKEENFNKIELEKTDDILSGIKTKGKKIVGFALESNDELANAKKKIESKNLDMIVLNSLNDASSGFEFDTNKVTIIKRDGSQKNIPLMSKFQVANQILSEIIKL